MLLVALSFHGLFEGIALGLSKQARQTITLMIAIIGHKWAESLTLGLSFFKTGTEKPMFIKMIVIFSLFTPVGLGLGMILNEGSDLISSIFMSLSVGTFLYIATSEVIVEEFSVSRHKWSKFLAMMVGILLITGFTIWEVAGDSHDDDHDHDH